MLTTKGRTLLIFKIIGQRSRIGNNQNPCIQSRGHSFDPILTKLYTLIAYDKGKSSIDFQSHRPKFKVTGIAYDKGKSPIDFQSHRPKVKVRGLKRSKSLYTA